MQESTSISRRLLSWSIPTLALALGMSTSAWPQSSTPDRTKQPEEDDFAQTPFTEYGEFNEEEDEAADTAFFQRGRFFGVSAGTGFQGIIGNRGLVWQGGFPTIDLKVHYWFDFNFALDLGGYFSSHFFDSPSGSERTNVAFFQTGLTGKYYFDTRNLSAPLSFAAPYLLGGFGSYTKIETLLSDGREPVTEATIGFNVGAGLEFVISPKKLYFTLEHRWHLMNFTDTGTQLYQPRGIQDLSGAFFTIVGSILFTW